MNPVLHKVMGIVAELFGEKISTLSPETRFVEDLHESLEFTETVMACEKEFGILIPDEEAANLITIGLLAAYIEHKLAQDTTVWPPAPSLLNKGRQ